MERKTELAKEEIERGQTVFVNSQLITAAKARNGAGGTEAACVPLGFVCRGRRQWSYSALSKQHPDYLSFHWQTIIHLKCAMGRDLGRRPTQAKMRVFERRDGV